MSGKSPIQWTQVTWNPVVGCKRVSAGCDHCYAFDLHDKRHVAWKRGRWPSAPAQYHKPFSQVQLLPDRLYEPLHWRAERMVFVNSMSDLFHEDVPDDFIVKVWGAMALAPQHTYQILTKRPERMRDWLQSANQLAIKMTASYWLQQQPLAFRRRIERGLSRIWQWPLPNVWLGVSVEHQAAADERIPLLLDTPAAVRFLSCEPLLGPVDLLGDPGDGHYGPIWHKRAVQNRTDYGTGVEWDVDLQSGVDWVIVGGESGAHARPMDLLWVYRLIQHCRMAEASCFVKQLGSAWARAVGAQDHHGGDISEWPEPLRVREWPREQPKGGAA